MLTNIKILIKIVIGITIILIPLAKSKKPPAIDPANNIIGPLKNAQKGINKASNNCKVVALPKKPITPEKNKSEIKPTINNKAVIIPVVVKYLIDLKRYILTPLIENHINF